MRKITEVQLPGVGVRYEFTSARGERIAVVAHRGGSAGSFPLRPARCGHVPNDPRTRQR